MPNAPRRTVVLDDDPTGSQDVANVPVLLVEDRALLTELLRDNDTVYVLTNSRALTEAEAVALLGRLRADIEAARRALDIEILVILRGDSTLRGHVFAEIDVFAGPTSIVVFAPAFPAGGRVTRAGVHRVLVDGEWLNAADTEFAADPVFGYAERDLPTYVRVHGQRAALCTTPAGLPAAASAVPPGTVLIPDVETDADLVSVAAQVRRLVATGADVVVRCAAPLAASLTGHRSTGLLDSPGAGGAAGPGGAAGHGAAGAGEGPVLVVVGSHTAATTAQLAALASRRPESVTIDTDLALRDPARAAAQAVTALTAALDRGDLVVLATARQRRPEHNTLAAAAQVMTALTSAVAGVRERPAAVVAKGGITSAEVARVGLGARVGWVEGQLETGISRWRLPRGAYELPYVVIPGNMGDGGTLIRVVNRLIGPP